MPLFGSGHEIVTSTTRPSTPVTGQLIYETNTNLLMMWNGSAWVMPTNGQSAGGTLTGTYPNPTLRAQWAAKAGPLSLSSTFKNVWNKAIGAGTYLDWNASNTGITVNTSANYEVVLNQRMSVTADNYLGISLNGDRTTLENRAAGIWSHDHEGYANAWCSSYYLGALYAGDIISGGGVSSTNFMYAASSFAGFLTIKYIGEL